MRWSRFDWAWKNPRARAPKAASDLSLVRRQHQVSIRPSISSQKQKQKSFSSSHSRFEKANLIRAPVSHHPSGIMNRHDPRRRRPQTATVAAASIRSRVRRRIRAHTRRHLRGRFSQSERFVSPSARSAPQQLGAVLARVRFRLDPTCSASCSLGS